MLQLIPLLARWAALELTEGWRSWGESENDIRASHKYTLPPVVEPRGGRAERGDL
jgi:hypothetical protein